MITVATGMLFDQKQVVTTGHSHNYNIVCGVSHGRMGKKSFKTIKVVVCGGDSKT